MQVQKGWNGVPANTPITLRSCLKITCFPAYFSYILFKQYKSTKYMWLLTLGLGLRYKLSPTMLYFIRNTDFKVNWSIHAKASKKNLVENKQKIALSSSLLLQAVRVLILCKYLNFQNLKYGILNMELISCVLLKGRLNATKQINSVESFSMSNHGHRILIACKLSIWIKLQRLSNRKSRVGIAIKDIQD